MQEVSLAQQYNDLYDRSLRAVNKSELVTIGWIANSLLEQVENEDEKKSIEYWISEDLRKLYDKAND